MTEPQRIRWEKIAFTWMQRERRSALFRAIYHSGGAADALKFVSSIDGEPEAIKAKIAEKRESLANPRGIASMRPGASPYMYTEGYIAGLIEALDIIEGRSQGPTAAQ